VPIFLNIEYIWQIAEFIFEDAAGASGVYLACALLTETCVGLAERVKTLYQIRQF
jgi:hypothetical protein